MLVENLKLDVCYPKLVNAFWYYCLFRYCLWSHSLLRSKNCGRGLKLQRGLCLYLFYYLVSYAVLALSRWLCALRCVALCCAQLRLPRSSAQALNETLAPHLKNKTSAHKDRRLPAQPYHAQISPVSLSLSLSPHFIQNAHIQGR